jgi:hypothetical protein
MVLFSETRLHPIPEKEAHSEHLKPDNKEESNWSEGCDDGNYAYQYKQDTNSLSGLRVFFKQSLEVFFHLDDDA